MSVSEEVIRSRRWSGTLEQLIDVVERDFPRKEGWDWLLRSNAPSERSYMANIYRDMASIRFPVYGVSRIDALLGAYLSALAARQATI